MQICWWGRWKNVRFESFTQDDRRVILENYVNEIIYCKCPSAFRVLAKILKGTVSFAIATEIVFCHLDLHSRNCDAFFVYFNQ